jgi:hypothetical protein
MLYFLLYSTKANSTKASETLLIHISKSLVNCIDSSNGNCNETDAQQNHCRSLVLVSDRVSGDSGDKTAFSEKYFNFSLYGKVLQKGHFVATVATNYEQAYGFRALSTLAKARQSVTKTSICEAIGSQSI